MIRLELESRLGCDPATVWDGVARMDAVNAELRPFVRLTSPPRCNVLSRDNPCVREGFSSWMLLFGLIPFDRHRFQFAEIGYRHFAERSDSWLNRRWEHDRTVTGGATGDSIVTDVVTVVPRVRALEPLVRVVVRAVFTRRHRYLRHRFGVPAAGR